MKDKFTPNRVYQSRLVTSLGQVFRVITCTHTSIRAEYIDSQNEFGYSFSFHRDSPFGHRCIPLTHLQTLVLLGDV